MIYVPGAIVLSIALPLAVVYWPHHLHPGRLDRGPSLREMAIPVVLLFSGNVLLVSNENVLSGLAGVGLMTLAVVASVRLRRTVRSR